MPNTRPLKPCVLRRAWGITTLSLGLSSACSPTDHGWDAKVRELCQKDGGVTVYERVRLSKDESRHITGPAGDLVVPPKDAANGGKPYVSESERIVLNEGNPVVYRWETAIVRTSDGKILSRLVHYGRVRSDGVDSGYSCRDVGVALDLEQQTFEIDSR
jgi:hypothetical protein